jgi:hypothetical protein
LCFLLCCFAFEVEKTYICSSLFCTSTDILKKTPFNLIWFWNKEIFENVHMIKYHSVIGMSTLTTISLLNGLPLMASSDKYHTWYILVILWYWVFDIRVWICCYKPIRGWNDPRYVLWLWHILLPSFDIWTSPRLGFVATQNPKPKSTSFLLWQDHETYL